MKSIISLFFYSFCNSFQNANNEKIFNVYWNSPTFQCKSHKIYFDELLDKYKISFNENVDFRGDIITILYDPGMFPAILTNDSHYYYRNGGLPQNGNISLHNKYFKETIEQLIPDVSFSGKLMNIANPSNN